MLIAPKRLKLRTSNLTSMFPGRVRAWPLKNFKIHRMHYTKIINDRLSKICSAYMDIKWHKYLKRYFYFTVHLHNRLKILSVLINKYFLSETKKQTGTRRRSWQCISPPSDFYRRLLFEKFKLPVLAINAKAQKFSCHMTLATPPFRKMFKGSCPGCPWKHARQIWNL